MDHPVTFEVWIDGREVGNVIRSFTATSTASKKSPLERARWHEAQARRLRREAQA